MSRRSLVLALSLAFTLFSASAFAQTLGAVMTGSQEVPATTSPGYGNFTMTLDAAHANATVTITVANLGANITGYHVHNAPAGSNGSIVFNIQGLGGTFTNGKLTGTFPITPSIATDMLANPQNYYANVHTSQFPGGAIRGQLSVASGTVITYAAELRGSNEVPANSSMAYGSAFVTVDTANNTLAWEVNTTGIASPTLSHIHGPNGPAGTNDNVMVSFASSPAAFTGGRTKGQVSIAPLSAAAMTALLTTPSNLYVNVHSLAFPGGEIRGQLVAANEYDIPVVGRVVNGLGQTFVTDVRVFNPSYDTATTALVEYFTGSAGNTNATASMTVNLPPRGTAVLDDVNGASNLNASGSTGGLRVSSVVKLAVTSRIYADLRSSGKGTIGQFAAGVPRANALRRGALPQLQVQGDLTSGFRTNVGFFNPNQQVVTVRLELRSPAGALVGSNVITLQALSQQQTSLGSYFPGVDLSAPQNLTLSFDASAPISAYAAVNDNISADSIFVQAQEDSGVAANNG
jgi:hypothetical protein